MVHFQIKPAEYGLNDLVDPDASEREDYRSTNSNYPAPTGLVGPLLLVEVPRVAQIHAKKSKNTEEKPEAAAKVDFLFEMRVWQNILVLHGLNDHHPSPIGSTGATSWESHHRRWSVTWLFVVHFD